MQFVYDMYEMLISISGKKTAIAAMHGPHSLIQFSG